MPILPATPERPEVLPTLLNVVRIFIKLAAALGIIAGLVILFGIGDKGDTIGGYTAAGACFLFSIAMDDRKLVPPIS